MIISKISTGTVIQKFDTVTRKYTNQFFIVGDDVTYEDGNKNPLSHLELASFGFGPTATPAEPYLPFDMLQPR